MRAGLGRSDAHQPQPAAPVDFNRTNDIGDTVVAAAAGTVTRVANEGSTSYGRWIEIDHGNGYTTRYAHLSTQVVHVGQTGRAAARRSAPSATPAARPARTCTTSSAATAIMQRAMFNGATALYFGTKNYTSNELRAAAAVAAATGTHQHRVGAPLTVRANARHEHGRGRLGRRRRARDDHAARRTARR